jgi:hypothetical protein
VGDRFPQLGIKVLMPRWIAFDEPTAAALQSRIPGQQVELGAGDVLASALASSTAVALLPATDGAVLILALRHIVAGQLETEPASSAAAYSAGGFLGLTDEPIFQEEEESLPKTRWWHKLLE